MDCRKGRRGGGAAAAANRAPPRDMEAAARVPGGGGSPSSSSVGADQSRRRAAGGERAPAVCKQGAAFSPRRLSPAADAFIGEGNAYPQTSLQEGSIRKQTGQFGIMRGAARRPIISFPPFNLEKGTFLAVFLLKNLSRLFILKKRNIAVNRV